MGSIEKDKAELRVLLAKLAEGQADNADRVRINELLRSCQELVQFYLQFMQVNIGLSELTADADVKYYEQQYATVCDKVFLAELARVEGEKPAIEIERKQQAEPQKVVEISGGRFLTIHRKVTRLMALGSVAAVLAMVVHFVYVSSQPVIVGRVVSSVNAGFADNVIDSDDQIYSNEDIRLSAGLVKIVTSAGAEVIVNGPAEIKLLSENYLKLISGRITVLAEDIESASFTVNAGGFNFVDYGTEFGVFACNGIVQTHVARGTVAVNKYGESYGPSRVMLQQGQAVETSASDGVKEIDYRQQDFVFADEYDSVVKSGRGSQYDSWRACIYQLRRDPSLLAQYFWGSADINSDKFVNYAPLAGGTLDGSFGDTGRGKPSWTQGRWGSDSALQFNRNEGDVIVIPQQPACAVTYPLTIALWAKFPDIDSYGGYFISCRNSQAVNFQFSLFDNNYSIESQRGKFEFMQYMRDSARRLYCNAFTPEADTWYHLAVTFDGSNVRFYCNGKLTDTEQSVGVASPVSADIVIGAATQVGQYVDFNADLNATIDELLIFKRALTDSQIDELYQAGNPYNNE